MMEIKHYNSENVLMLPGNLFPLQYFLPKELRMENTAANDSTEPFIPKPLQTGCQANTPNSNILPWFNMREATRPLNKL